MGDHQSSLLVIPWATVTLIHPNVQTHPQLSATQHISTGAKFKFAFFISQFVPIFHPWNTVPSPTPIFHRKLYIYIFGLSRQETILPHQECCVPGSQLTSSWLLIMWQLSHSGRGVTTGKALLPREKERMGLSVAFAVNLKLQKQ